MKDLRSRCSAFVILCLILMCTACAHHHQRTHKDMIRYGIELAEKGYWKEAAVQWRMVLNEDPENVAALNNLGVAAEVNNHPADGRKLLLTALKYEPEDKRIQKNLASIKDREKKEETREADDE